MASPDHSGGALINPGIIGGWRGRKRFQQRDFNECPVFVEFPQIGIDSHGCCSTRIVALKKVTVKIAVTCKSELGADLSLHFVDKVYIESLFAKCRYGRIENNVELAVDDFGFYLLKFGICLPATSTAYQ